MSCPSCQSEIPDLLSPRSQRPDRENRSGESGIEIVDINLNTITVGVNIPSVRGAIYGWKIIRATAAFTGLFIKTGSPIKRISNIQVDDDSAYPAFVGAGFEGYGGNPIAYNIHYGLTGSNQNVRVRLAILTKPVHISPSTSVLVDQVGSPFTPSNPFPAQVYVNDDGTVTALDGETGATDLGSSEEGAIVSSRLHGLNSAGTSWNRLNALAANAAENESSQRWLSVRSAISGLNQSSPAGSRQVPVEALGMSATNLPATANGIVGHNKTYDRNGSSGTTVEVYGDDSVNVSGRITSAIHAMHVNALITKEDKVNAVLRTVETHLTDRDTTLTPTSGTVLSTLDGRGLVHWSLFCSSVGGGDVRVDWSDDGTNWNTGVETVTLSAGVSTFFSEATYNRIRGARHIRLVAASNHGAGNVVSEISCKGS